jgi:hypothetical protein
MKDASVDSSQTAGTPHKDNLRSKRMKKEVIGESSDVCIIEQTRKPISAASLIRLIVDTCQLNLENRVYICVIKFDCLLSCIHRCNRVYCN